MFIHSAFGQTRDGNNASKNTPYSQFAQEENTPVSAPDDPAHTEFLIPGEQPNGVAERVYLHYEDADVALRSYAAVDVGGCSGTMIGPDIAMTAGHCGQGNRNATFRLYTAATTKMEESFPCQYLTHTFADTDLNIYWCNANMAGEHAGDKFGYADFDIVIDPVTGAFNAAASRARVANGTSLYSIWMNPIDNIGGGWHAIYSEGQVDNINVGSWYTPNTNTGAGFRCGNSACSGGSTPGQNCDTGACGQTCGGTGECQGRPTEQIGVHSNLWSNSGASGSSQFNAATHRLLIGPLSVGAGNDRGRSSLCIADYLVWGFTDANLTCPTCCMPCVTPQVNQTLLTNLGVANPAAYYGPVDANNDGLFDVQSGVELITGEHSRNWYWLGFESHRRNNLWTRHLPGGVAFDTSDPATGVATLSTVGQAEEDYILILSHSRLNLPADRYYNVSCSVYLMQSAVSNPIRVALQGTESHWADFNPPAGIWSSQVSRLWASSGATLRFQMKKNTKVQLAAVSLVPDNPMMNFDTHDKRYMWRNHNTGGRGRIWPNGPSSGTQPDWAGVVYRDRARPLGDDWPLRNRQLAIDGGAEYHICFDYRTSSRDPLTGNISGVLRMLNENGEIVAARTGFSPDTTWRNACTAWFYVPTDDNNLQFGVQAGDAYATGAYLVDNIQIERRGPSVVYVNWSNLGFEEGTSQYPYNTVREGISAVRDGGEVNITSGQYPETMVTRKAVVLTAPTGSVVIGS